MPIAVETKEVREDTCGGALLSLPVLRVVVVVVPTIAVTCLVWALLVLVLRRCEEVRLLLLLRASVEVRVDHTSGFAGGLKAEVFFRRRASQGRLEGRDGVTHEGLLRGRAVSEAGLLAGGRREDVVRRRVRRCGGGETLTVDAWAGKTATGRLCGRRTRDGKGGVGGEVLIAVAIDSSSWRRLRLRSWGVVGVGLGRRSKVRVEEGVGVAGLLVGGRSGRGRGVVNVVGLSLVVREAKTTGRIRIGGVRVVVGHLYLGESVSYSIAKKWGEAHAGRVEWRVEATTGVEGKKCNECKVRWTCKAELERVWWSLREECE
jgi:hypothetical protein